MDGAVVLSFLCIEKLNATALLLKLREWGMTMEMQQIADEFALEGEIVDIKPHGNGHINDTYLVTTQKEKEQFFYILQHINTAIFTKPEQLMANILGVTEHLRKKFLAEGKEGSRCTLTIIPVKSGNLYYKDGDGKCYRMYTYIDKTRTLEQIQSARDFSVAAEAFGEFRYRLSDYPADSLYETIPDFHNTPKRYERFLEVVTANPMGRVQKTAEEIAFIKDREAELGILCDALQTGELPLSVTHNDTKLNNILLDEVTGEAVCIIDLDTVMPGSVLYDIGDSIRFGASTAAEDEPDLSKVSFDLELFRCYVESYCKGCRGTLSDMEYELLPMGAKLMTLECGMRFLTDYLEGDVYFKIHREHQNLERCRTQLKLVADMEQKWNEMKKIVREVREHYE